MNSSRGLRSSIVDDLLKVDYKGEKLQYRQLFCHVIDDILTMEEGTPFLLCTTVDDEERFGNLLKECTAVRHPMIVNVYVGGGSRK